MAYTREQVAKIMVRHNRWLTTGGNKGKRAEFSAGCIFGVWCIFGAGCKAISPYWSFQYCPPFTVEGRIYPTESARPYWKERLGMKLEGCYGDIYKKIKPELPKLLRQKKWTKCERMILESWAKEHKQ